MSGDRGVQRVPLTKNLTQWDEVLMSKGIVNRDQCLLAKGFTAEQVLDIYEQEALEEAEEARLEAAREAVAPHPGESASIDELDELEEEEEFADDAALAKYRETRMRELKEKQALNRFGTVENIGREDWLKEVNTASEETWVLVHLYEDSVEACQVLDEILIDFAKEHKALKCVRIRARSAVENWPEDKVPVIFLYHHGEMQHQLFGHSGRRMSSDFSLQDLKELLSHYDIISTHTTSRPAVRHKDTEFDDLDDSDLKRGHISKRSFVARPGAYDAHDDATWDKSEEDDDLLFQ